MTLNELKKGQIARVSGFSDAAEEVVNLLREIGFAEADEVELMHTGPFGVGPFCYRLNRTMIALRPAEAGQVIVELA